MIENPLTNPIGTITRDALSPVQKIFIGGVVLIALAILLYVATITPSPYSSPEFAISAFTVIVIAGAFIQPIISYPSGKPYLQITDPTGLKGEFSLGRLWPRIIEVFTGLTVLESVIGIIQAPAGSQDRLIMALTGLSALVLCGFLLFRPTNRVTSFRLNEGGTLSIKRDRGDWTPLHVTDYQRIVGHRRSGKSIKDFPSYITFLDPLHKTIKPFTLPVTLVKSRLYGSWVYGIVVDKFFYEACKQANYQITFKPNRWEAVTGHPISPY